MFSPRNLLSPLMVSLALSSSACEIVADFDRDKINQSNVTGELPMIPPSVPPEKPQPVGDGGSDDAGAGADAGDVDAGEMDSGPTAEPPDAGTDGGDASEPDAGADAGDDASTEAGP